MSQPRAPIPPRSPAGSGGSAWRPSTVYALLAAGLVVAGLGMVWMVSTDGADKSAQSTVQATSVASAPTSRSVATWSTQTTAPVPVERPIAPDTRPTAEGDNDPMADLSSYVSRGAQPSMNEVIERLRGAGIGTGLAAFNPPGTRPNKVGLAVPEDFVLPEGFVRHHQATDDGQRVEAILMFSPDRPPLDVNRQPIAIPANRVVPPELAPAGLPIRQIVIPPALDPGRVGL